MAGAPRVKTIEIRVSTESGIAQRPSAIRRPAPKPVTITTAPSASGVPPAKAVAKAATEAEAQAKGRMRNLAEKGMEMSAIETHRAPSAAAMPGAKPNRAIEASATANTESATATPLRM